MLLNKWKSSGEKRVRIKWTRFDVTISLDLCNTFFALLDLISFVLSKPLQLALHTLNASRSAYQCITFQSSFFDVFAVSGPQAHFSVLLKVFTIFLIFWAESIEFIGIRSCPWFYFFRRLFVLFLGPLSRALITWVCSCQIMMHLRSNGLWNVTVVKPYSLVLMHCLLLSATITFSSNFVYSPCVKPGWCMFQTC